jgi:UDP-N-acetylmuramoylalanine--D-glutamate ligase
MSAEFTHIVVLGAAESGVGAALLAKKLGFSVFVSDGGVIKDQFKKILSEQAIEFEEGGHTIAKIIEASTIIKSPGISEKNEAVKIIRKHGIELISEIEFGFRYKGDSKIIAITGSNGKSTATSWIYDMLVRAEMNVALVGNIGISFAKQIAENPCEWYVMEVSSFQLDDIKTFRPNIAVLLNITPDHLDRYEYKFENYVQTKFKITENQIDTDCFVINQDDDAINAYLLNHTTKAKQLFFTMSNTTNNQEGAMIKGEHMIIDVNQDSFELSIHELSLRGKHNQYNSMAAGISAKVAGIRKEKIRESLTSFNGLSHRLEKVATIKGVEYINDSKATNVNAVWFALESMNKPTVLILGGVDKGNDYNEIAYLVEEKVKAIICLGVDNTILHQSFEGIVPAIYDASSATEAVKIAYEITEKGDAVLLSPACASFDLFKNFEDRGEQFKNAVKAL